MCFQLTMRTCEVKMIICKTKEALVIFSLSHFTDKALNINDIVILRLQLKGKLESFVDKTIEYVHLLNTLLEQ